MNKELHRLLTAYGARPEYMPNVMSIAEMHLKRGSDVLQALEECKRNQPHWFK